MNFKFEDKLADEEALVEIKKATDLDAELDEEGNPLAETLGEEEELE